MSHFVIWILVVSLYSPVFWKLYKTRWETIDYTHAYFILPISLWLIVRNRSKIKDEVVKHRAGGNSIVSLLILCLGMLMFIFGWREGYFFFYVFSLIPLLFGLVGFLYGRNVVKVLNFPILYLLLLVPPPGAIIDDITLPMRYGVSFLTEEILKFLEYPITRDGLAFTVGYTEIFMGEPCSGFRSLITMFSLVLVYVYISKSSLNMKLILTSFIVPFALLGNLIRVITLCLITFYFGEEAGQGFFHNFSGIIIFVITLLGILGVESLLNKRKALAG